MTNISSCLWPSMPDSFDHSEVIKMLSRWYNRKESKRTCDLMIMILIELISDFPLH